MEASRLARVVAGEVEAWFGAQQGTATKLLAPRELVSAAKPGRTLSSLVKAYMADPAHMRTAKTLAAYRATFEVISDALGPDRLIGDITRDECRHLVEVLRWMPTNPKKRFPKLRPLQASAMARKARLSSTMQPATVNAYLNRFSAVLNFAVEEGELERNPARGLRVADSVRQQDKRLPFSLKQLQAIFNAPLYRGCMNDRRGYADVGPHIIRRGRFWVPLIGLFSGMRLNEICQLHTADVAQVDGVWCFLVRIGDTTRSTDKRLKTAASERVVPVHHMLLKLGLIEHVEDCRERACARLFDDLPPSKLGYYSDPFSKWFSRFLLKAGAARGRTCFHSFRHSFRDALRDAGAGRDVTLALGGWTGGKAQIDTHYGSGPSVAALADAVRGVGYPGLDLKHLVLGELNDRA